MNGEDDTVTHIHIDGSVRGSKALLVIDGVEYWVQCSVFHVVAMLGRHPHIWTWIAEIHGDHTARYVYRTRKALPMLTILNSCREHFGRGAYSIVDCTVTANRDNLSKYPDARIVEAWK